jgi:hypothetical protein
LRNLSAWIKDKNVVSIPIGDMQIWISLDFMMLNALWSNVVSKMGSQFINGNNDDVPSPFLLDLQSSLPKSKNRLYSPTQIVPYRLNAARRLSVGVSPWRKGQYPREKGIPTRERGELTI